MSLPEKISDRNPLKELAKEAVERPGMYLIELRAHLNRGKTLISDVIESVSDAFPSRAKVESPE